MDELRGGVRYITPNRRSLRGVTSTLRRIVKTIDPYDVMLLLAGARIIADNHPPRRAVEIAAVLGARMVMDEVCKGYGLTYEFPNKIHRTVRNKPKCVLIPALKTVTIPEMYRDVYEQDNPAKETA